MTGAQVIGIDEWAKCKGRTYGTLVVDLEPHTVIDVLDEHSTEAVEQWLVAHPDIQMICRDRNGRYAKPPVRRRPQPGKTTDQFHLVQNLRETIERELALHRAYLRVRVHRDRGACTAVAYGPCRSYVDYDVLDLRHFVGHSGRMISRNRLVVDASPDRIVRTWLASSGAPIGLRAEDHQNMGILQFDECSLASCKSSQCWTG